MGENLPEIEYANKPSTEGLTELDPSDIRKLLASLPKTKYMYGQKVIETRSEMDTAKYAYDRAKAKQMMLASSQKEDLGLSSEKDRSAWVLEQKEVVEAELQLVSARLSHELAKTQWEYCDDMFVSVRKVASIIEAQEQATRDYEKYRDPQGAA